MQKSNLVVFCGHIFTLSPKKSLLSQSPSLLISRRYQLNGLQRSPIEAAHRNALQQRMNLSGQKWSIDGANTIANLRCYKKGGSWGLN